MTFKILLLIACDLDIYAIYKCCQYHAHTIHTTTLPEGTRNLNVVLRDLYCCEPVRQFGILF